MSTRLGHAYEKVVDLSCQGQRVERSSFQYTEPCFEMDCGLSSSGVLILHARKGLAKIFRCHLLL